MSGKKFRPGQSGNPRGRPVGSSDRRTAYRSLFQDKAPELAHKAVELALAGDTACLKMCVDRIVSPYRAADSSTIRVDIGNGLVEQGKSVVESMLDGSIAPSEASSALSALAMHVKIIEVDELDKRLQRLESGSVGK